jgi:single-strand DNA-binding protein
MNRVMLMGKLSFEPELRKTHAGVPVANLSVTTQERLPARGDVEEKVLWEHHKVVVWGKTAESCAQYLHKGSLVFVEGKLRTESYEKEGRTLKVTKVSADAIKFLDPVARPPSEGTDDAF